MAPTNSGPNKEIIKAALTLYGIGCIPLPLFPNSTVVSVDFGVWLDELSPSLIEQYWRLHPHHGLSAEPWEDHTFPEDYSDDAVFHE